MSKDHRQPPRSRCVPLAIVVPAGPYKLLYLQPGSLARGIPLYAPDHALPSGRMEGPR